MAWIWGSSNLPRGAAQCLFMTFTSCCRAAHLGFSRWCEGLILTLPLLSKAAVLTTIASARVGNLGERFRTQVPCELEPQWAFEVLDDLLGWQEAGGSPRAKLSADLHSYTHMWESACDCFYFLTLNLSCMSMRIRHTYIF